MKNVDQIIRYLSREMSPEELASFEGELASSPVLKEAFEQVSKVFHLVRDQLQKRDEQTFREKLLEAMESSGSRPRRSEVFSRFRKYFLFPLGGAAAILLAFLFMRQERGTAFDRFFDPAGDPVLYASGQLTRGETGSGIALYREGQYREAMERLGPAIDEDQDNQLVPVYYLLSSLELDLQDEALEMLKDVPRNADHQLGQSLTWYTALALLKSEREHEAVVLVQGLSETPGPYRKDAQRLQKMLLK